MSVYLLQHKNIFSCRTNSDSALHTSATAPQEQQEAQQQHVAGDGNITDHRRDNSADSALENSLQLEASIQVCNIKWLYILVISDIKNK